MSTAASSLAAYRLTAGFLLGIQCFYSFGVTLVLFRAHPSAEAGRIVAVLFPVYYLWIYACGAAALILILLSRPDIRRFFPAFISLSAAIVLIAIIDRVLGPMMGEAKLSNDRESFGRLHGISMGLNLLSLFLTLAASILPRVRARSPHST